MVGRCTDSAPSAAAASVSGPQVDCGCGAVRHTGLAVRTTPFPPGPFRAHTTTRPRDREQAISPRPQLLTVSITFYHDWKLIFSYDLILFHFYPLAWCRLY